MTSRGGGGKRYWGFERKGGVVEGGSRRVCLIPCKTRCKKPGGWGFLFGIVSQLGGRLKKRALPGDKTFWPSAESLQRINLSTESRSLGQWLEGAKEGGKED